MKNILILVILAVAALISTATVEAAISHSQLFYKGKTVRTIANPHSIPYRGLDPLYVVTNGVEGQLDIAGVAPGDDNYHGGRWAVFTVTFNEGVEPRLLTSGFDVGIADAFDEAVVVRAEELDNRCPVLPN